MPGEDRVVGSGVESGVELEVGEDVKGIVEWGRVGRESIGDDGW